MMHSIASFAFGLLVFGVPAAASGDVPASSSPKMAANAAYVRGPVTASGPVAGDDFGSATLITALPFGESGNTCVANDDYAPDCAFDAHSTAPDLVYLLQPAENTCVDIALCGSDFDNTLSVYEDGPGTLLACSDDACALDARVESLTLTAGHDYFIVVDGWAEQCGGYQILVTNANPVLRGTATYFAPGQNRIPGVEVCTQTSIHAPRCAAPSDNHGAFKVTDVIPGSVSLLASKAPEESDRGALGGGDVNTLIAALAAAVVLTPDQEIAADVDGSGRPPNAVDLQKLRRFLVFDFTACPGCDTWGFFADSVGTYLPLPAAWGDIGCGNGDAALKGIYRADVDGSWPDRFKVSRGTPGRITFGAARWDGAGCVLPLALTLGEAPSTSALFTLAYDNAALEWAGADVGVAAAGFELTVNPASAGVVHGLLAGGMRALQNTGAVAELHFRLRPGHERADVAFTRLLVNDEDAAQLPGLTISPGGQTAALPRACTVAAIPNPFNPSARVEYTVPAGAGAVPVSLRVIDLAGHVVRDLVQAMLEPGRYTTTWNGTNAHGESVASGVYVLQLRAGRAISSQKAVLVR